MVKDVCSVFGTKRLNERNLLPNVESRAKWYITHLMAEV